MLALLLAGALNVSPSSDVPEPRAVPVGAVQTRARDAARDLPDNFEVNEKFWSWTTSLSVEAGGRSYGRVSKHFWAWTTAFTYEDASGACLAKARQKALSWGVEIEVTDCAGRSLGEIHENVWDSAFGAGIWNKYTIFGPGGAPKLAESDKVQFLTTSITLTDASGQVARLYRPVNLVTDTWAVGVSRRGVVDKRLLVFIAAYKTAKDNDSD